MNVRSRVESEREAAGVRNSLPDRHAGSVPAVTRILDQVHGRFGPVRYRLRCSSAAFEGSFACYLFRIRGLWEVAAGPL